MEKKRISCFHVLRGKTAKEAKEKRDKYYGTFAPLNTTIKRWMQKFKIGRASINNELS